MEDNCFTILLASAIPQHESAIGIHMSLDPPSQLPPDPTPLSCHRALSHKANLSFLHHTANSHWLCILYMVMYMFQGYFFNSSLPLLPPLYPQVCSLCLHLHCCSANRFISAIFLDSIYMHSYTTFVFLTYFTLYNKL